MVTETTVSTDAQDYPPGAWTEITATGFDPGSIVTFQAVSYTHLRAHET